MMQIKNLYQKEILSLNKSPLNYGILEEGDCFKAEYHNPHCGDTIRLFILLKKNSFQIEKITFDGESCAVTKASASLMTESLKERNLDDIKKILNFFFLILEDKECNWKEFDDTLRRLRIFSAVKNFPSRKACAILPWKALETLLLQMPQK